MHIYILVKGVDSWVSWRRRCGVASRVVTVTPLDVVGTEVDHAGENRHEGWEVDAVLTRPDVVAEHLVQVLCDIVVVGPGVEQQDIGKDGRLFTRVQLVQTVQLHDHSAVLVEVSSGGEQARDRVELFQVEILCKVCHPDFFLWLFLKSGIFRPVLGLNQQVMTQEELHKQRGVAT